MLLIPCPHCGPRNEHEFLNGGEAGKRRPEAPSSVDDEAWYEYLCVPSNTKGWLREWWWHARGCQRWFKIERHTCTHRIRAVSETR